MGYVIKYAVLWEENDYYELAGEDYFDSLEEAQEFINDMELYHTDEKAFVEKL